MASSAFFERFSRTCSSLARSPSTKISLLIRLELKLDAPLRAVLFDEVLDLLEHGIDFYLLALQRSREIEIPHLFEEALEPLDFVDDDVEFCQALFVCRSPWPTAGQTLRSS